MDVKEKLKRTTKGQLVYNRQQPTKQFLAHCASPPELSSFHTENVNRHDKDNRQHDPDNRQHHQKSWYQHDNRYHQDDRPQHQKSWFQNDNRYHQVDSDNQQFYKGNRQHRNNSENEEKQRRNSADYNTLSDTSSINIEDISFKDLSITVAPQKPRVVITVSPDYGRSVQAIKQYEESQDIKVKLVMCEKEREFIEHSERLIKDRTRKMNEMEEKSLYKAICLQEQTEEHYRQREAEQQIQCQKLKEEHMKHAKMLEIRHQKLQEEIRRKEQEKQERIERINQAKKDVKSMVGKLASLQQTGANYNRLSDDIQTLMDKVKDRVKDATQLEELSKEVSPDVESKYVSVRAFCVVVYEEIKKKVDEEEKRQKEEAAAKAAEEARKKAEEQQKAQQSSITAAATASSSIAKSDQPLNSAVASIQTKGDAELCVDPEAFLEYTKLQEELKKAEDSVQILNTPQTKKLKFDLQKSINIPINAISPVSGSHLKDKLQKLRTLLSGQQVEVSNKHISVGDHPQASTFCKHLIAKMIVKKAEEQVSSKHESSFAIAMVAIGVWSKFPDVGSLLLANFHSLCPYTVPYHIPRQEGQSVEDYHKALGYKYDSNGVVEKQDKFLKRMSGIMRLYAAILISSPPEGNSPHGVEHAWSWLARVMNIRPLPDVTATMIYDMLCVTGNTLHKTYQKQFQKMLHYLIKEYLPKLKSVASAGGGGPVSRLEMLLQNTLKNHGQMVQPEGYLQHNFWFS